MDPLEDKAKELYNRLVKEASKRYRDDTSEYRKVYLGKLHSARAEYDALLIPARKRHEDAVSDAYIAYQKFIRGESA